MGVDQGELTLSENWDDEKGRKEGGSRKRDAEMATHEGSTRGIEVVSSSIHVGSEALGVTIVENERSERGKE